MANEMTIFFTILFFSLINCSLFILSNKWGFTQWYELHRRPWMPPKCEFCTFFWLAVIELGICYFINFHFETFSFLMVFAFSLCSAVVARFFCQGNQH